MNINLNEEASLKLLGRLTLELNLDMQEQLKVKNTIDEVLYDYEVTTKCTELAVGDIHEKAQLFIACKKLEGLSNKTLYNYRLFLSKLGMFFNKPISTITTMDLRMFLAMYSKNKKASTQNSYITMIKNFFTWLQNEEYILKNPSAKLKQAKVPKVILQPYTNEEVEKLRDVCKSNREKALFEVLISSACRIDEIAHIKIYDIDMSNRTMKVTGKGNKQRIVYLSTRAVMYIDKYIKEERKGDSEYLFVTSKIPYSNMSTRSFQKIIKELQKRSRVTGKVHAHRFRRTQATHLLNSGMSITGVQAILGHESPDTTQRYARLSQDNLANEFKRLIS